jgi:hypothetical protein
MRATDVAKNSRALLLANDAMTPLMAVSILEIARA